MKLRKIIIALCGLGALLCLLYHAKSRIGVDIVKGRHISEITSVPYVRGLFENVFTAYGAEDLTRNTEPGEIIVHYDKDAGRINPHVFGANLIAYDPATYESWARDFHGYYDYGAGIWDPKKGKNVEEVIDLARAAGITMLRFPGGCGTHHYDWKVTIGPQREHFLYGLDEFMATCRILGAEPVITVSYFTGDEDDAADLVEYLNAPDDGTNPCGGTDWASLRARNGHPAPYGVRYFEIGNEVWHGDHRSIGSVEPREYAARYLSYCARMKKVDPGIAIGALFHDHTWNSEVVDTVGEMMDFAVVHIYPRPGISRDEYERVSAKDIFEKVYFISLPHCEEKLRYVSRLLKEKVKKDIPLAVTEYNVSLVQERPLPYRHCLATALANAELLTQFMEPGNNVAMAHYWNFNNSYTGMIANGFHDNPGSLYDPYYARPNYYVHKMYREHFGTRLLPATYSGPSYDAGSLISAKELAGRSNAGTAGPNLIEKRPWIVKKVSGVRASEAREVLQIEFDNPSQTNYFHSYKRTPVEGDTFYRLSGYIKADSLKDPVGVCLEVQDGRGWGATHSAAATRTIRGTNEWRYVEVYYKTLPEAEFVNIYARRNGSHGPYSGKAYFKETAFQKFTPREGIVSVPYLSVNASRSNDGDTVYLMVVNKKASAGIHARVTIEGFGDTAHVRVWVLNGPELEATNEGDHARVTVTPKELGAVRNGFTAYFEPHSITALEVHAKETE